MKYVGAAWSGELTGTPPSLAPLPRHTPRPPAAPSSRPEGRLAFLSAPRAHLTSAGDELERREVDAFGRVLWYRPVELLEVAETEAARRADARAARATGTAARAAAPAADSGEPAGTAAATGADAAAGAIGPITWADVLAERRMLRAVRGELELARAAAVHVGVAGVGGPRPAAE